MGLFHLGVTSAMKGDTFVCMYVGIEQLSLSVAQLLHEVTVMGKLAPCTLYTYKLGTCVTRNTYHLHCL